MLFNSSPASFANNLIFIDIASTILKQDSKSFVYVLLFETYSVVTLFRTPHNHFPFLFCLFDAFIQVTKGKNDKDDKKVSLGCSTRAIVFSASLLQRIYSKLATDAWARRSRLPVVTCIDTRIKKMLTTIRKQYELIRYVSRWVITVIIKLLFLLCVISFSISPSFPLLRMLFLFHQFSTGKSSLWLNIFVYKSHYRII